MEPSEREASFFNAKFGICKNLITRYPDLESEAQKATDYFFKKKGMTERSQSITTFVNYTYIEQIAKERGIWPEGARLEMPHPLLQSYINKFPHLKSGKITESTEHFVRIVANKHEAYRIELIASKAQVVDTIRELSFWDGKLTGKSVLKADQVLGCEQNAPSINL